MVSASKVASSSSGSIRSSEAMEVDDAVTASTLTPDDVSPTDLIARRADELVTTINHLANLGIEGEGIALPRIVAVGDQSSGKSSLIEAITGARMPRDSGTCTRVPFHINTTRSAEHEVWSCSIFLDIKYSYHKDTKVGKRTPFGPWSDRELPTSEHFAELSDPAELEAVLKQAQLALLNPCKDSKSFRTVDDMEDMEIEFSPNVVRIEIRSPDVRKLSFYDLPGIFAQTADGQEELPRFVCNLVSWYIRQENNIILLVIPMNVDRDNCYAGRLVKSHNALERTVGVLTKPDQLQRGEKIDKWISILRGETYRLGHGYWVTRQPAPHELQMTRNEAKDNELHFFLTNRRWHTDLGEFQLRFGALKIQEKLGELLVDKIKKDIPQIFARVDEKLCGVKEGLSQLPPPPGNKALSIVLGILSKLEHDFQDMSSGNGEVKLFQKCLSLVHQLQDKLRVMSPGIKLPTPVITLDGDDFAVKPKTPSPKKRKAVKDPSPELPLRMKHEEAEESISPIVTYTLDDLRTIRTSVDVSGIFGTIDTRALQDPINSTLGCWFEPVNQFISAICKFMEETINATIDRNTSAWCTTPLAQKLRKHTIMHVIEDQLKQHAQWKLSSERSTYIMIFDDDYFQLIKGRELVKWRERLESDDLERQFKPELELYASIRAYLHVCNKSLTHHLGKHVLAIFREFPEQIMLHFRKELGLSMEDDVDVKDDMDTCKALLEEDSQRSILRRRLEIERKKYEEAKRRLGEVMHAWAASISGVQQDGVRSHKPKCK